MNLVKEVALMPPEKVLKRFKLTDKDKVELCVGGVNRGTLLSATSKAT